MHEILVGKTNTFLYKLRLRKSNILIIRRAKFVENETKKNDNNISSKSALMNEESTTKKTNRDDLMMVIKWE